MQITIYEINKIAMFFSYRFIRYNISKKLKLVIANLHYFVV